MDHVGYVRWVARCVLRIVCCVFVLTACRFPGTVQPTVKIGLVAPFEGRYRYVGYDVIYAVRLALREAGAAGGIEGYSVELVAYDDSADPAMAVEQVRKLAADPAVVAAIGHFREDTTAAAISAYAEADIPLVVPAVLDPLLAHDELAVHRLGPAANAVADELLRCLEELGVDHAALVTEGAPLGAALRQGTQRYDLRVEPVASPESVDWPDEVLTSNPEAVLCDAGPVVAGKVVSALRLAGWHGIFLGGPELAAADFAAVAGEAAEGAIFVTPWPYPEDVPGGADFSVAYRNASNGAPPGPLALPAYEAAWMLLEALGRDIAAHGESTRGGMAEALTMPERSTAVFYWYRIDVGGEPQRLE